MTKITQFVNEFELAKNKLEYVKKHIVATYIPYEVKVACCNNILKFGMYKTVNEKKVFWINTPIIYQLFVQTIISSYTDIDLKDGLEDEDAVLKGFNRLEQIDALPIITEAIGKDFDIFNTVLKMIQDDEIQNNSFQNYIDTKIEAVGSVINTFISTLEEQIKNNPQIMELIKNTQVE